MIMIRNSDTVRDRLLWALAEEDRSSEAQGVVRNVVESDVLPSIIDADPQHLVQLGMRAVIRDVQEWIDHNTDPDHGHLDAKGLRAYLLAALIAAGASEDPVAA